MERKYTSDDRLWCLKYKRPEDTKLCVWSYEEPASQFEAVIVKPDGLQQRYGMTSNTGTLVQKVIHGIVGTIIELHVFLGLVSFVKLVTDHSFTWVARKFKCATCRDVATLCASFVGQISFSLLRELSFKNSRGLMIFSASEQMTLRCLGAPCKL
jgi:hypothetical protein